MNDTFVLLKPDTLQRGLVGRIITRIEDANFAIFNYQERHKTLEWARQHYVHMYEHSFFEAMCEFMSSSSVLSFNVCGKDAMRRLRLLSGSAVDPSPGTIRFDFGASGFMNLIHVSDDAERERKLFYDSKSDVAGQVA
jgi:nucleoside-diphosphate kinase